MRNRSKVSSFVLALAILLFSAGCDVTQLAGLVEELAPVVQDIVGDLGPLGGEWHGGN
ncbi:MAG: hypothetical protein JXQ73_24320 [Phycisphaerae bacterium]|nr:hypothetical protein [Phycisphaerae bacterium]